MDSEHEFADRAYVRKWAATADQRRPDRGRMFTRIVELLQALGTPAPHVVELGCGPGTLARTVLCAMPQATYDAFDYSEPMLEMAREELVPFGARARLHQADLRDAQWPTLLAHTPRAIITNQALHDLGSAEAVGSTYRHALATLAPGGLFVNAELVVPVGGSGNKPGKLFLAEHLALLREAGFVDVRPDLEFGEYVGIVARMPA